MFLCAEEDRDIDKDSVPGFGSRAGSTAVHGPTELRTASARLGGIGLELRSRYVWILQPLAFAAAIRILVLVAGDASEWVMDRATFPGVVAIWSRADAVWYVGIARDGYMFWFAKHLSANFFPLYPLTIRIIQPFIGLFVHSESYLVAGMAISWAAFLAASVLLFRLVWDRFGRQTAYLAVLLLGIFPFSFYYGAAYTESLYLACALLAFLGIERGNWWLAGIGALLAGATRPTGLIVGLVVGIAYLLDWIRSRHHLRWDLLALGLAPLGAAAFALYCWFYFGNPLAYMQASAEGWGGHLQLSAVVYMITLLTHPVDWTHTDPLFLTYAVLIVTFPAVLYPIYRLLGASYLVFSLLSSLAPLLDFPGINSTGRYLSVIFPAFIVLAYALQGRPVSRGITIAVFTLLLTFCVFGFVAGYGFY